MIKAFIFILLLVAFSLHAMAIGGYQSGDTLYNLAVSGLKIRSLPGSEQVTGKVPYGAKVVVCPKPWGFQDNDLAYASEGISGNWVKIRYADTSGFVFDGFLCCLPAPKQSWQSLKEYAEKSFTPTGEKVVWDHSSKDETFADTIQFFTYKGFFIIHEDRSDYESFSERLTIQGVTAEECYLLARILYKTVIDTALAAVKRDPSRLPEEQRNNIGDVLKKFSVFKFENGKLELDLFPDACIDFLEIRQLSPDIYVIDRYGGC